MPRETAPPPSPAGHPVVGHAPAFARDPFGFVSDAVESVGGRFVMNLLGREIYVLADPTDIETALLDRESFAKLEDFRIAFGDALLSVEGEQWRRQRHAMEGFFSPQRIRDHADTIREVTERHTDAWEPGQRIELDSEMRQLALENLFEVVLGHSLSDEEFDELATAAHALNLWFKPRSWVLPHWVPTPARYRFRQGAAELRSWAESLLSRTGPGPADESLLSALVALRDDPSTAFDQEEILDQVVGMLFAGHETTALAMTYALHQLGRNGDVAERVAREIDDAVEGTPALSTVRDLSVLDDVIDETLRLFPPVHAIPRVTTTEVSLGEHTIPRDTEVLLAVWNLHRDGRFYDDPETFRPERWVDTTPRERGYEYVPFGAGPRICIGRHFARLEMKLALVTVLRRYRIEAPESVSVTPQMTSQPSGTVPLKLRPREDA
ncbi:cytochrome P450 [Haloarcula halophila]|uniref:cytochrome P450 n=1 Tax=Haloarcula TaxID=2237 RepID=UPI0023E3EECB|nr:cytochrome P450 [Halomicroarcula sp. DFY41]